MNDQGWAPGRQASRGQRQGPRRGVLIMTLALLTPAAALAQLRVSLHADSRFEQDSNVYYSANSNGGGDAFIEYGGGLLTSYQLGRETLSLDIQGRQYRYDHLSNLDHEDYRVTGALGWKFLSFLDGSAAITRSKEQVSFQNFVGNQLVQETNQNEHFTLNLQTSPNWRIETGFTTGRNDSPRPGLADLSEVEDSEQAAFKYTIKEGLAAGISGSYTTGTFEGTGGAALGYHQSSAALVLSQSGPISSLAANIGYTRRASASGLDDTSGTTGSLSYQRKLSGRTSINVQLSRGISSYITNTGAVLNTTASTQITYIATRKISLGAAYTYTIDDLPKQGIDGVDRTDHSHAEELHASYAVNRSLDIQAYARREERASDLAGAQYSSYSFGIFANLRFQALGR